MKQLRKLTTAAEFADHLASLSIELPFDDRVSATGSLSQPVSITDASAGTLVTPNRFAILPMEGWDAEPDGRPSDLVERRWRHFANSGAGLVWAEATAVRADGRANPRQLVIAEHTVEQIAALRAGFAPDQIVGLQLTHSGRYARPQGDPAPRIAYHHRYLDEGVGASAIEPLTDKELDQLVDDFVEAACRARVAGFDFVDVKACHGYLGHELLTAHDRPGRYGGDLQARTRFLRSIIEGIRAATPELAVAVRLSAFDVVPHVAGPDGIGRPVASGPYANAFGGDGTGTGIDLTETHRVLDMLTDLGVGLISATAGSPYYCPHVQRPAFFPPSDGYRPPEDPLVGVARQLAATAELARAHAETTIIGSGYSYLQEWLPHVGQAAVAAGGVSMVGLGRMALSYPDLPAQVLRGEALDTRRICRTFSDCTTAPRAGLVSGCYPIDPFYKARPERVELAAAKKAARERLR